jgi:hypothetical protein
MQAGVHQNVAICHLLERMLSRQTAQKMEMIAKAQPPGKLYQSGLFWPIPHERIRGIGELLSRACKRS